MGTKYKLIKAFHPTLYEKDIWRVHFNVANKPLFDIYTKATFVKARNRKEAIKLARKELMV